MKDVQRTQTLLQQIFQLFPYAEVTECNFFALLFQRKCNFVVSAAKQDTLNIRKK